MRLKSIFKPRRSKAVKSGIALPPSSDANSLNEADLEKVRLLLRLVNERSQPNINDLIEMVRDIDVLALNVKAMGYELARRMAAALPARGETEAVTIGLESKASTQRDMESAWVAHWCAQLKTGVIYSRKLWEFCYALQALFEQGCLSPSKRGIGFGVGTEPMASYLGSLGQTVMITDLPADDQRVAGWSRHTEYAHSLRQAHHPHLVDWDVFSRSVEHRAIDMNALPNDLGQYDFCWSICALEHLGSIAKGAAFIENAMAILKPGGVAIHTLEFNVNPEGPTIDNWGTVLFQQKHIERLRDRLTANGHHVAALNFDVGSEPLDHFIDIPPWGDGKKGELANRLGYSYHLKRSVDGFVATCFGLVVTKAL